MASFAVEEAVAGVAGEAVEVTVTSCDDDEAAADEGAAFEPAVGDDVAAGAPPMSLWLRKGCDESCQKKRGRQETDTLTDALTLKSKLLTPQLYVHTHQCVCSTSPPSASSKLTDVSLDGIVDRRRVDTILARSRH